LVFKVNLDWPLAAGFWWLVTGCWQLVSGFWLLETGFWLLALCHLKPAAGAPVYRSSISEIAENKVFSPLKHPGGH